MTNTPAKTFDDGVREERARIAAWLETQRKDQPAHGWEFAAALRAENPGTPGSADIARALNLMWAFATTLVERHGMTGDDSLSDADHKAWQAASGAASAALREHASINTDWISVRSSTEIELRPITSAARQWAIDALPDGINPTGGTYRVDIPTGEALLLTLQEEQFSVTEWKVA